MAQPKEDCSLSMPLKMYQFAERRWKVDVPIFSGFDHSRPSWQYLFLRLEMGHSALSYSASYFWKGERQPILAVKFPMPFLSNDWLMLPQMQFFLYAWMQRQGMKSGYFTSSFFFWIMSAFLACSFSLICSSSASCASTMLRRYSFSSYSSSLSISSLFPQCYSRQLSFWWLLAAKCTVMALQKFDSAIWLSRSCSVPMA